MATAAQAQAPTARDGLPDKMPNFVLYVASISPERADAVLTAAISESKARGWAMNCVVYESYANLVTFKC